MLDLGELLLHIRVDSSEVGTELSNLQNKLNTVGKTLSSTGTKATAAFTVPIVGAATEAANSFAEVDKVMQLTNATMQNTEEQAELLDDAMKQAAANSTYGMSDAANAMLNFARSGLTAEEAAAALAPAMNLAAGEGGNLDTVSAGLTATINGFGDSFNNTAAYADVFASACNNSALDIDSLSQAMSVAAPIFSAAGYTVNDAALYMGVMANNGIEANVAANSLKTGMARLVSPAKEGADMMEQLGISITNADGSMKDSLTIQSELHDSFSKLSESEQLAAASAIFGKEQMAPWLALINTAPEDVDDLSTSLDNCAGTTDEMSSAMMEGFGGSIEKLKSSIDVLKVSLGELIANHLQPLIDKIQGVVDKFNSMDEAEQEQVLKIAAVVAAIGPLLIALGKIVTVAGSISGAIGKVVTLFGSVGTAGAAGGGAAAGGLGSIATAAGPIAAILAGIVAAGYSIVQSFGGIEGVVNRIKESFDKVKQSVADAMEKYGISEKLKNLKEKLDELLASLGDMKGLWDSIIIVFETVASLLADPVVKAFGKLVDAVAFALDILGNLTEVLGGLGEVIHGVLTGDMEEISSGLKRVWGGIKDTVTETSSAIVDNVTEGWNNLVGNVSESDEELEKDVTTTFGKLKDVTQEDINEIDSDVRETWTNMCTELQNTGENTRLNVDQTWADLKDSIIEKTGLTADEVEERYGDMKEEVVFTTGTLNDEVTQEWLETKDNTIDATSEMEDDVDTKFSNMTDTVTDEMGETKKVMEDEWGEAVDTIENTDLESSAGSMISNFKTGLQNAWTSVTTWASNAARSLKNTLEGAKTWVSNKISGKHRTGLREVPYDGYVAELHRGERVLTAVETNMYDKLLKGLTTPQPQPQTVINFNGQYSFNGQEDIDYFMTEAGRLIRRKVG